MGVGVGVGGRKVDMAGAGDMANEDEGGVEVDGALG